MLTFMIVLGSVAAISIAVGTGWRLLSRRIHVPCPSFLSWLLENPLMEGVAGSGALIQRAHVGAGMRILDAGCGPGRLTVPLARAVGKEGRVVAIDLQGSMVSKLRERVERTGLSNVHAVHAGLGTGALAEEHFDRAFLVTVLGEIPDQEKALREIFNHLTPGGILSVTEVLPDPHYQRRSVVHALALKAGFVPELVYHNYRSFTMNLHRPEPLPTGDKQ